MHRVVRQMQVLTGQAKLLDRKAEHESSGAVLLIASSSIAALAMQGAQLVLLQAVVTVCDRHTVEAVKDHKILQHSYVLLRASY
jgi:hypothetical protein